MPKFLGGLLPLFMAQTDLLPDIPPFCCLEARGFADDPFHNSHRKRPLDDAVRKFYQNGDLRAIISALAMESQGANYANMCKYGDSANMGTAYQFPNSFSNKFGIAYAVPNFSRAGTLGSVP